MFELQDSPLCPIRAFKLMCQLVPAPHDVPAFYLQKGSIIPIHAPLLDSYLKRLRKAADISNPEGFSFHSCRRGGASFYFKSGVPGGIVQLFGNWASDCYLRYFRFTRESLLDAAFIVSRSVPCFLIWPFFGGYEAGCLDLMCIFLFLNIMFYNARSLH